jgi:hypothetical protein
VRTLSVFDHEFDATLELLMKDIVYAILSVIVLFGFPNIVEAKVLASSDDHFIIEHEVLVPLDANASYQLLGKPSLWWNAEHTWSGNAQNLSLQLKAGGCFCESRKGNSVMHAQVISAQPGSVLKLQGALGPLQDMAVNAVLSFSLKKQENGTKVVMTYRVSGDSSHALATIAPIVDKVLGEQIESFRITAG